jgi:fermentation-respiration switch protein FrsA (DUF1100 family)
MGGSADVLASRYAAVSPVMRPAPPTSTSVLLVTAEGDRTVPVAQAEAYFAAFPGTARERVPGGHFDLVAPWTPAWARISGLIRATLAP